MHGWEIWSGIIKGIFENILFILLEINSYVELIVEEFLVFRAHTCFWNTCLKSLLGFFQEKVF